MSESAELLAEALRYYQAGQWFQAEQACRDSLQAEPGQVDALHVLAAVAQAQGAWDTALAYLRQAVQAQPENAVCHFQLGLHYDRLGHLEAAVQSYGACLRLQPDLAPAYNNLGVVLQRAGQWAQAEAHLQQALTLRPDYVSAYLNLGNLHLAQSRWDEAAAGFRTALQINPASAEAHANLGVVLEKQGHVEEASASFREALRLRPDFVPIWSNLAHVLAGQEKWDEAAACYRQALHLQPDNIAMHNALGTVLTKQGKHQEAIPYYQAALALDPHNTDALTSLGVAWAEQGNPEEALRCHAEVLRLAPDHVDALANLGLLLHRQGRLEEALAYYEAALRVTPDLADAHWNRGMIWLKQGNFSEGWPAYEWRWRLFGKRLPFQQPRWDGSDLAGRTILLYAEQGLGDALQFIRYAPLVAHRGGTVVVQCHEVLQPLFASCAGIDRLVPRGAPLPPFDVQAALLSLPSIFGTSLKTVPANVPYLAADPKLVEQWRQRLASATTFNIGIVWQGNNRERAVSLEEFAPLGRLDGVRLISLQKGTGREQLAAFSDRFAVVDPGDSLDEVSGPFMDTAAILQSLDLMITVDTAIAHLAGALAVPVWVALAKVADWRWLLDRTDSPWYPTMRLFRQQEPGNWSSVFAEMAETIRQMQKERGMAGDPSERS